MKPQMPSIEIDGDEVYSPGSKGIMAATGDLAGFSRTRMVWRFGFMENSDMARAFDVHAPEFYWVLSDYSGKILVRWTGFGCDLPKRFRAVLDAKCQ